MITKKYLDSNGNVEFAFSSSVPGLGVVPIGRTIEEAVDMPREEYQAHIDKMDADFAKAPKLPTTKDLQDQIEDLKSQMIALKANSIKPTKS